MNYSNLLSKGRGLSQFLGVYPIARSIYHYLSPNIRRERRMRYRLYAEFVSIDALCFDIGANVGQSIESMVACGANVVALEPNPACYPVLEWQFGRKDQVQLLRQGAGEQPGELTLNVSGTDSRASIRRGFSQIKSQIPHRPYYHFPFSLVAPPVSGLSALRNTS